MNISIIGTGYVGLVSGVCLAEKGHNVTCVDNNENKIQKLKSADCPIHERNLDSLLSKNIGKNLKFTTSLKDAILNSDISIIAVGTPFNGEEIDLIYIEQVSKEIGIILANIDKYHTIIVKSTIVPGTTDNVIIPLIEKYSKKIAYTDFGVGMNPEFLREGVAVSDFMDPDRIVLGGNDRRTLSIMEDLYSKFTNVDIIKTNNKTAEMIKYTANSLLASLISFSNEIGNLCASMGGIDVTEVMNGVHLDKRISPILDNNKRIKPSIITYIEAGCGFGGSCYQKDVKALISHGVKYGVSMELLTSVININNKQPEKIIEILINNIKNLKGVNIAVLGLSFKPGTDDMRESPSIPIIKKLSYYEAIISAYDPIAEKEAKKIFSDIDIKYRQTVKDTIFKSEAILILTKWPEFENLHQIISELKINPLIIDGRRMLPKNKFKKYKGIGC